MLIHRFKTLSLCALIWVIVFASGTAISQAPTEPATAKPSAASSPERERAFELMRQGKSKEAVPLLEKLVAENPNDAVLLENLGVAVGSLSVGIQDPEERKKQRVKARSLLLRSKGLGNTSDLLPIMLELYSDIEDRAEDFSKNQEVERIMHEAEKAFGENDMKKALDGYIRALLIEPNLYSAALFAGDAYLMQKTYGSAGEWFARAIQINPDIETAYRYWGDALMVQGKLQEARAKFIEAIIAEPYSVKSWTGLQRFAKHTNLEVKPPDIKSPNSLTVGDKGKDGAPTINININADTLKANDGSSAWMFYEISRSVWRGDRFKKEFPNEKQYRHSLREESGALSGVAESAAEQLKSKKVKELHPSLATLLKLKQDGLIEAYVLLTRPDQGIAQDYVAYRAANREKLRRYLDEYVVPKLPN